MATGTEETEEIEGLDPNKEAGGATIEEEDLDPSPETPRWKGSSW